MSGVFRIIDPHPLTAFGAGGGHTRWVERGCRWGVNSSEDAKHCSVLYYICKYFVPPSVLIFSTFNLLLYKKGTKQTSERGTEIKVQKANS
jgi:hypothetical protein